LSPRRGQAGLDDVRGPARIENLAVDLRLQSVRIARLNFHDTDQEYAIYTFSRVVHDIRDATGFGLVGFDTDSKVSAREARLVHGDPTSVLVGFAPGTDLTRYSLATVAVRAVEDESGRGNLPASVTLAGSALGAEWGSTTDAPDLIGARPTPTLQRVEYTFDVQLDNTSAGDADRFGYFTADGMMVAATSVVTMVDHTVTARFDGRTEDGVRFYALGDAVKDQAGKGSTVGAVGGPTTAPDLVSVAGPVGRSQFDFTFDQAVTHVDLSKLAVYAVDGTRYAPRSFVRPSAEAVRVSIPELQTFADTIVLGAAETGAVRAADGSDTANTTGTGRIGGFAPTAGTTAAPDLITVVPDLTTGQVRFGFDQPVDDDRAFDARDFFVVTPAGDLVPGRSYVETAGHEVEVTFDRNVVAAAVGAAVSDGAVQGFQGKKNPPQLVMLTTTGPPTIPADGPPNGAPAIPPRAAPAPTHEGPGREEPGDEGQDVSLIGWIPPLLARTITTS
jgi:hypothetical protein